MTSPDRAWSAAEQQTIVAARMLATARSVFVGVGQPSVASILARLLYNDDLVLVYESGTLAAKPRRLPLSIGDGELAATSDAIVSVPEIFNYWIAPGRIDVAFLGAAQIDRFANLNSTVIGDYARPTVRLPGAGGAPDIAAGCEAVIVILAQARHTFVPRLDFRTTFGHGEGTYGREELGLRGRGPTAVVTDLGVLEPDAQTRELTLTQLHPGCSLPEVLRRTGWPLRVAPGVAETLPPCEGELETLRKLLAPTNH